MLGLNTLTYCYYNYSGFPGGKWRATMAGKYGPELLVLCLLTLSCLKKSGWLSGYTPSGTADEGKTNSLKILTDYMESLFILLIEYKECPK